MPRTWRTGFGVGVAVFFVAAPAASGEGAVTAAYAPAEALAADAAAGGGEERNWAPRGWVVGFEASLWAPGLGGDIELPGGGGLVSVERLGLDDPEAAPFGELSFRADRWIFSLSGFGYGFDDRVRAEANFELGGLEFARDDMVDAEFDFISAQVTAGYRIAERLLAGDSRENGVALLVDITGGLRLFDVDASFEQVESGDTVRADDTWIEPTLGARLSLEILEDFTIDLELSGGVQPLGDTTSLSFDVVVGFAWRFLDTAGAQIGYRFLYTDLESDEGDDGEFRFQGSLAGLYAGVVLRY